MRKKRKSFLRCLVSGIILMLLMSGAEVSASRKTQTISDSFDDTEFLEAFDTRIWTDYMSNSSMKVKELQKPEKILEFQGKGATGETAVLMSKDWYWEIYSLSFDMKIPAEGSWAAVDFVDIDDPQDYVGDYGENGEPMCYYSMRVSSKSVFGLPNKDWTYWGFDSEEIANQWISVKLVSDSANSGKIYIAPRGQAFDESKGCDIILGENRSFYNSNIVFLDYQFSGYQLDNIVIDTDTGTYKEDFESGEKNYFMDLSCYSDTTNFSFHIVDDHVVRKLGITDAVTGDRLIANKKLQQEDEHLEDNEEVMHTSFAVTFSGNSLDEEIAYVFGLAKNDSNPFIDTWAYVMNKKGGRIVRYDEDGNATVCGKHNFKSTDGSNITLSLTKNGILKVLENGSLVISYSGIEKYKGFAGFVVVSDISKTVYLDNVEISNTIYNVVTTKTVFNDFETDNLGDSETSDFVYNEAGGTIRITDGELVFDGCSDGSYFGPSYEYETYEMTFKLTSILGTEENDMEGTGPGRWIGIDFGKQDVTQRNYGTYGMLYIRITPPKGATEWNKSDVAIYKTDGTGSLEGEELKIEKEIPSSLFKDITYDGNTRQKEDISANAAVCFKVVSTGNKIELYLKRADEQQYIQYATLENVNPEGHVALVCTAWTFWSIDDFEVKNTATIYNDPVAVEKEAFVPVSYEERGIGVEDIWWEKEQKLNEESGLAILWVIGIVVAVIIVAGGGAIIFYQTKKKKKRVTDEKKEDKEE